MARKEKNIHYIYKTTCNVTGKWYIGMHSTTNLNDGYMGSGKILRYSIRKYGAENHTKEILEYCETRELLIIREREIVNKELISDGLCINLKEGGTGGFSSEEHMMNYFITGSKNLQEKLINDIDFKNNWLNNLISGVKKSYVKGRNINCPNWKDKTHSEETKALMSEYRKGTGVGENNSQYGTCWITKDGLNKKIKKEDLEPYLNEGWIKGRK